MKKQQTIPLILMMAVIMQACTGGQQKKSGIDAVFKKLAVKLSTVSENLKSRRVAVFGFEMIGRKDHNYSRYATEKLTNELVEAGRLQVLERSQINKVLREQNFNLSGAVDASKAARIGKILAVEGVVIGSVIVTGNQVEIMARVVQSETAVILKSASHRYSIKSYPEPGIIEKNDTKITTGDLKPDTIEMDRGTKISIYKTSYRRGEPITIAYSGLPGNAHDWIMLVKAGRRICLPETT